MENARRGNACEVILIEKKTKGTTKSHVDTLECVYIHRSDDALHK